MLLYSALWLNARAHISQFMGELRQKMQGALGRGSRVGLFVISFSAVLRESVETAVFLQGLALDSVERGGRGAGRGRWCSPRSCSSCAAWATGCP